MVKGVLLDLSGVVYVGDTALPGAVEAIARLRDAGLPVRYLTNTTRTPKRRLLERLDGMGLSIESEELFTPAAAARAWLESNRRTAHLLIHPDLEGDFQDLPTFDDKAVVLGDAGTGFTYETLNDCFRTLIDGADFLALAANRTFRDSDGALSLDAGAFVAALEFATQRRAIVLGKPSPDFFTAALASMGCPADAAVMVGDDAEMDVAGALAAGLEHGLLVRTGKYRPGAEACVEPSPSAVVDDLPAAADWILESRSC